MKTSSAEFSGRIFVVNDEVVDRQFWSYDFYPMNAARCSTEEWVARYFDELDVQEIRELFCLESGGDVQILFAGRISGGPDWNDEYDERVDIVESSHKFIPAEYAKFYLEPL